MSLWDTLASALRRPPAAAAPAKAPHIELGRRGEEAAARHLESLGWRVLERGFRSSLGQIDLIARDGETIVFIEVKARTSREYGLPEETISERQKRRIVRAALIYLKRQKGHPPARFDVIAIDAEGLRHHENAFSAEGYTY